MQQLRHMKVKAYTVISIAITVGIAVTAFLCFPHALGRLVESLRDLGMSFACFFTYLFGHSDAVTPTFLLIRIILSLRISAAGTLRIRHLQKRLKVL